jgi:hypothetical protein
VPVLSKTPSNFTPSIAENTSTIIASVIPNIDEEKAAFKQPEPVVAKTPVRKFRIVHNNETLIQQNPDIVKTDAPANHGFSLFKPSHTPDVNAEEHAQEEALPPLRKREKSFIKGITNSIKDN